MSDFAKVVADAHRARLFPVLAENSKEGRAVSILLACLGSVGEFGRVMLASLGQRVGTRAQIQVYTEVAFPKGKADKASRPDGLIVLRIGQREWKALIEAKIGSNELEAGQLEAYCDLARANGVDALITISNQFASIPSHHPVQLPAAMRRKLEIYHWSWMNILTQATLLIDNEEIADQTQRFVLSEFIRFLTHPSAGVKGFDQMPAVWPDFVARIQAGGKASSSDTVTREVVAAWHQEVRDLSLILSRQLGTEVRPHLPRVQKNDVDARIKADVQRLVEDASLVASLEVPDAASNMDVRADVQRRAVVVSMRLRAPEDKKSNKARINWLLRQIDGAAPENIHVRVQFPGRAGMRQIPLSELRASVDTFVAENGSASVVAFEVLLARDLGARFAQRKAFLTELESSVPDFYERVGQHLKAWQARAPRLREDRAEPESVSVGAIGREGEMEAKAEEPAQ